MLVIVVCDGLFSPGLRRAPIRGTGTTYQVAEPDNPPDPARVCASLVTGVRAHAHNILTALLPQGLGVRPADASDWRVDPAWRRLSAEGRSSVLVAWPATDYEPPTPHLTVVPPGPCEPPPDTTQPDAHRRALEALASLGDNFQTALLAPMARSADAHAAALTLAQTKRPALLCVRLCGLSEAMDLLWEHAPRAQTREARHELARACAALSVWHASLLTDLLWSTPESAGVVVSCMDHRLPGLLAEGTPISPTPDEHAQVGVVRWCEHSLGSEPLRHTGAHTLGASLLSHLDLDITEPPAHGAIGPRHVLGDTERVDDLLFLGAFNAELEAGAARRDRVIHARLESAAESLDRAGAHKDAERLWRTLIERTDEPGVVAKLTRNQIAQRRFTEAASLLNELEADAPDHPVPRSLRARWLAAQGRPQPIRARTRRPDAWTLGDPYRSLARPGTLFGIPADQWRDAADAALPDARAAWESGERTSLAITGLNADLDRVRDSDFFASLCATAPSPNAPTRHPTNTPDVARALLNEPGRETLDSLDPIARLRHVNDAFTGSGGAFRDIPGGTLNSASDQHGSVVFGADPDRIESELHTLGKQVHDATASGAHPILVGACWFRAMLRIHPFADGNGRAGRLLLLHRLAAAGLGAAPALPIERAITARRATMLRRLHATEQDRADVAALIAWHRFVCTMLREEFDALTTRARRIRADA